jgi:hypothetical protein
MNRTPRSICSCGGITVLLFIALLPPGEGRVRAAQVPAATGRWVHGLPAGENYFPIAVWLQSPRNAERFKAAGINLYVGLWDGPTADQLEALTKAGMPVICSQNPFALAHQDNPIMVGWMHGDEPDNAQSLGRGRGYGPPILPEKIQHDYERIVANDPTRPVMLNLGQGVAYDNYIGRGVRRNHPEDYPEYLKGCDIASFDIYPVVHDKPEVAGKLEFVALGVQRLVNWTGGGKRVWNCIECTHIGNPDAKATPDQVRAEVWMALIHGSQGLIYFVHQFAPTFKEAALLDDPAMLGAVTAINRQIHELASVLNSPTVAGGVEVKSSVDGVPIAGMEKRHGGSTWLFTVNMRNQATRGILVLKAPVPGGGIEVLGESRRLEPREGTVTDDFKPYEVHLYRFKSR